MEKVQEFKEKYIFTDIIKMESDRQPFFKYLSHLPLNEYTTMREKGEKLTVIKSYDSF